MKVYKSLEEKIDHVLRNVIRDLNPDHLEKMRTVLLIEDLTINDLIKKARTLLLPTEDRPIGRSYWLARGWPLSVAQAKIVEARKKKKPKMSPFSQDFWLSKINPDTGAVYTVSEAEFKRNSLRPIRPEYWIVKGYSSDEAKQLAIDAKNKNNISGAKAVKNRNVDELKSFSRRSVEYWIARGLSTEEAGLAVKNAQTTFSLAKLQEKHGEEVGIELWQRRQDKWQNTLNSKSLEELEEINKRKIVAGFNRSKDEMLIFSELQKIIPTLQNQIYIRDFNKKRGWIFDIGKDKKLIEYNGTYWHADPRFYAPDHLITKKQKIAKQIHEDDKKKLETAQSQGYEVLVIWEHDFRQNKQREIEKCINFLTQ